MLHLLGVELPRKVFGHPWLLFGNDKMSKSKGNIAYADDLVNRYGVDSIRFYMLHDMPFSSDGNYTEDLLVETINSNLANVLGNLVNRSIGMANKYFEGIVTNTNVNENIDKEFIDYVVGKKAIVDEKIDSLRIADALEEVIDLFRRCNKYIDETTPWVLAKDENEKDKLETVIYNLLEAIRVAAINLKAFLPETSDEIFRQLNTDKEDNKFLLNNEYNTIEPKAIFQRIDKEKKLQEIESIKQ
jgi:methionyl-tRNA synthetase